jgi:hypothetical protein
MSAITVTSSIFDSGVRFRFDDAPHKQCFVALVNQAFANAIARDFWRRTRVEITG